MTTTFNLNSSTINTVEVGDALQTEFYPQLKIKSWDNECNLSVRLTSSISGTTFEKPNGEINWYDGANKRSASFYDYTTLSGCEDGGYEFEVLLDEKPESNVLEFSIRTKGFDFFYQGELTDEEKYTTISGVQVQTNFRPDNVVGSYAVYHKTKQHGQYGTGKAFHIFRPWAEDAAGKRVWCDLWINEVDEKLTITIPRDFWLTAQYPVLVDPTFGNTSAGSSYQSQDPDTAVCFLGEVPAPLAVDSVTAYVRSLFGYGNSIVGVTWDGSDGSVLTNGVANSKTTSTTATWQTSTYSTSPACQNGSFYFGIVSTELFGSTYVYYDNTNNTYPCYRDTSNSKSSPQTMDGGSVSYKYSIYITYTQTGPSTEYDQTHTRWRNDDGSETTATWLESEDTTHSGSDGEARLRFLVHNSTAEGTDPFTITYSTNASTWEELPTTSGGGSHSGIESDDFNDNSLDTGIWTVVDADGSTASGTINEQNNRIEFSGSTGTTNNNGGSQLLKQSFTASTESFDIQFKVTDIYIDSNTNSEIQCNLYIENSTQAYNYGIEYYNGTKYSVVYNNSSWSFPTFNWSLNAWIRAVYDGSNITLYYSENGTDWTSKLTGTMSNVSAVYIYCTSWTYDTTDKTGYVYVDDFVNNTLPTNPVYIKDSINITNGSSTTAQLTPPSGLTTSDFVAGEILDTSDTSGDITTTSGSYTELEWSLGFNEYNTYYFRVADLDTYTEPYATYIYCPTTATGTPTQRSYYLHYRKDGVTYDIPLWDCYLQFTEHASVRYNNETSFAELDLPTVSGATDLRIRKSGTTYAFIA